MSYLNIGSLNGVNTDRWTDYSIEALTLSQDIRTKPDTQAPDSIEQSRAELRVSVRWDWKDIVTVQARSQETTETSISGRFNGGDLVTLTPQTDSLGSFKLMDDTLTPVDDRGFGVNEQRREYVSIAAGGDNGWVDIDWTLDNVTPDFTLESMTTQAGLKEWSTFSSCDGALETAINNEYQTNDNDEDEFRVKLVTTQFFDVRNISEVSGLTKTLGQQAITALPNVGYNDGTAAVLSSLNWLYPMFCSEIQIVPIDVDKGTVCRVKFRWESWDDWDWASA